jgi:hypothetical protein
MLFFDTTIARKARKYAPPSGPHAKGPSASKNGTPAKSRFAPEAAVPGIAQTDLVARTRPVDSSNFSSSRALAPALNLMTYQLNYVGPMISLVGNDRLLKRIRRENWVFGAVVRPRSYQSTSGRKPAQRDRRLWVSWSWLARRSQSSSDPTSAPNATSAIGLADIAISNTVIDAERTQLAQSANSIRIG